MLDSVYNLIGGALKNQDIQDKSSVIDIIFIVVALSMSLLMLFIGRKLWNTILVKTVTIINPIESMWEFFLLLVLLRILFPINHINSNMSLSLAK